MFKTVKTIALAFAIITLITTTSCLDTGEELPVRTLAMEMETLNKSLTRLESEGYDIDTTELGIYYILHEAGEGQFAQAGDTLNLEYTGYLMDGLIFDASSYHHPDGIWEFVFKDLQLIPGFDDGISKMNKGAELDMFIPSEFAYGATGNGNIQPFTTLVFATKMHDLRPKSE